VVASVSQVITIGLDIAKNVFHAHGTDERGAIVFSRKLTIANWQDREYKTIKARHRFMSLPMEAVSLVLALAGLAIAAHGFVALTR
jgi:transposase